MMVRRSITIPAKIYARILGIAKESPYLSENAIIIDNLQRGLDDLDEQKGKGKKG
jgi:hypothetical protein